MKGNLLLIAALAGELKPLVSRPAAGWRRLPSTRGIEVWERPHHEGRWLAVCAGMGARRAALAFAEAEKTMQPDAVCSIGWAGALDKSIAAGEVWGATMVVDTQTGEHFEPAYWLEGSPMLVTTEQVADAREKARLAASYGAGLIDMEAAAVARIALGKGIPFYCLKAVSDDASADLPNINPFIGPDGQLNMLPFLWHVAWRPASWAGLAKLGKHSSLAAQKLADAIYAWLEPRLPAESRK